MSPEEEEAENMCLIAFGRLGARRSGVGVIIWTPRTLSALYVEAALRRSFVPALLLRLSSV